MAPLIQPKVQILGNDKIFKLLKKRLGPLADSRVDVGVQKDAGVYAGTDVTVAQVALWNEFGTSRAPERSFIRSTMRDKKDVIRQARVNALKKVFEGKWDVDKALQSVGLRVQILIQNAIKSNINGPLAESTLARRRERGNNTTRTLIDTGLLLRSIGYRVRLGEGNG